MYQIQYTWIHDKPPIFCKNRTMFSRKNYLLLHLPWEYHKNSAPAICQGYEEELRPRSKREGRIWVCLRVHLKKKDMWVCLKIVYIYIYTHIPESPNHMIDRHFPVFKGPPYVWCKSHTFFPHFQIKDSIGPKEAAAHHGSCQECERIAVIRPAMGEFGAGLSCHAMQNVMVAEGPREFRQRCAGWCATTMETKQRKHVWAGAHWL